MVLFFKYIMYQESASLNQFLKQQKKVTTDIKTWDNLFFKSKNDDISKEKKILFGSNL